MTAPLRSMTRGPGLGSFSAQTKMQAARAADLTAAQGWARERRRDMPLAKRCPLLVNKAENIFYKDNTPPILCLHTADTAWGV